MRGKATASDWRELCAKFDRTGDEELSLFDQEIEDAKDVAAFECRGKLLGRLRVFFTGQRLAFELKMERERDGRNARVGGIVPRERADVTLPSIEIPVDVTQAAVYSPGWYFNKQKAALYGGLPQGGLEDGQFNLTFDDGPFSQRTRRVLDVLDSAGVRANFFMVGRNAKVNADLVREIAARGHVIGSHSKGHPILSRVTPERGAAELLGGRTDLEEVLGSPVHFFRFPGFGWTDKLVHLAKENQMPMFFTDLDSLDWKNGDPTSIYNVVKSQLRQFKKGIVLFHDPRPGTGVALPYILEEMGARNLTTVVYTQSYGN